MDILLLSVLLLSLIQVGAKMKLSPASLTIVRGDEAVFTCSPSTPDWTVMEWRLKGRSLLTISKSTGVLPTVNPNVTAVEDGIGWQLVLKNTQKDDEGEVICELQHIDFRTANLFVQERGTVTVFGDNRLAFKGQSVLFQCQAAGWYPQPVLQWLVDRKEVNQQEYNISTTQIKSLFTVTSNLSVMATKSFPVHCLASVSALKKPLKSGVNLTVVAEVLQEEQDDCTVPLAVTASLSALLLLTLLCICIVLCYRHRKQAKANPQEAKGSGHCVLGRSSVAAVTGGNVNLGYSSEGPTGADYSEIITEIRSKMDFASFHKVPDVVHVSSQSLHSESHTTEFEDEESSNNVRRITTV
ncbi:uncharacterized protein igsf5b isoform X2 [Melanotaenia boesemani]|uniref:uncharacterized protein igsf5b isoform X2 n=1 Tax=Melanotaenia boesemani TaxID=1250792 RepID=UPI001C05C7EE|nr:uncharacterized protein igsf5b isoform X2 [Melanotaenia boesemani]